MKSDDFTRRLFEVYDQVRNDNQQVSHQVMMVTKIPVLWRS